MTIYSSVIIRILWFGNLKKKKYIYIYIYILSHQKLETWGYVDVACELNHIYPGVPDGFKNSRMRSCTLSSMLRRLVFLCGDSIYICTTENVCLQMLL